MSRKVIVTGGAQGIGEAIVRRLAADGATIAVLDRNVERARAVATSIDTASTVVDVDLADAEATRAACAAAIEQLGGCDVLVNDAGIFAKAAVDEIKRRLQTSFEARDLGEAETYLGINITRNRGSKTLKIDQERMVKEIVGKYDRKTW